MTIKGKNQINSRKFNYNAVLVIEEIIYGKYLSTYTLVICYFDLKRKVEQSQLNQWMLYCKFSFLTCS